MQRVPGPLLDLGLALMVAAAVMIATGVAPQPGRRLDALAYVLGLRIAALVLDSWASGIPSRSGQISSRGSLANQVPVGCEFRGKRRVAGEAQDLELAVGALARLDHASTITVELTGAKHPDDWCPVAQ
jgi:hypothetical protein